MDVTPQSLKDVEFRQALRGYDPDEVDLFLQRVSAGVAQLQGRLSEAISRAEAAEARIDRGETSVAPKAKRSGDQPSEETITRTLLLAQQTADKLLTEARDEASTTLSQVQNEAAEVRGAAQAEAEELRRVAKLETDELRSTTISETDALRASAESETSKLRRTTQSEVDALRMEAEHASSKAQVEAEAERNAILSEVESEARAVAEETRRPLLAEIRELENRRDFLAEDTALLEHHVDAERSNLLESIARLQSAVDAPDALRVSEVPTLSRYSKLEEHPDEVVNEASVVEASVVEASVVEASAVEASVVEASAVDEEAVETDLGDAERGDVAASEVDTVEVDTVEADASKAAPVDLAEQSDPVQDSTVEDGTGEVAQNPVDEQLDLTDDVDTSVEAAAAEEIDLSANEEETATDVLDSPDDAGGNGPSGSGRSVATGAAGVAGGVAVASSGSFIDRFGASPTTEPATESDVLEAVKVDDDDVVDLVAEDGTVDETDDVASDLSEIDEDLEIVESPSTSATVFDDAADSDLESSDLESSEVEGRDSVNEVHDFERTPIADDLGFVDPDAAVATSSEDDVLPVFDDDDFFSDDSPVTVADDTGETEIDLRTDPSTGSSFAAGSSIHEPTQAISLGGESQDGDLAVGDDSAEEPTGDAFLEELRRAVSDEDTSDDDDPALVAFFDDDSDGPTKRFGRQR